MKYIELLNKYDACRPAIGWLEDSNIRSIQEAWDKCERPDWLLWLNEKFDLFTHKQMRLMACRFVRETPLADGRTVWDLLTDERSRNAVIVAERYAHGEASDTELTTARDAAWDGWAALADSRDAALAAALADSREAAWDEWAAWFSASRDAALDAALDALREAAFSDSRAASRAANATQCDIIRSYTPDWTKFNHELDKM